MRRAFPSAAVALLAALAAAACSPAKAPNRVVVATEAQYPPFEYVEKDGTIAGFDIDLVRAACRESGLEAEFVNQPFGGIIPGLQGGKYDAAVSAMTITEERARVVAFSDPYYEAGLVIAVRADEAGIAGLADLEGRTLAVQMNTTGHMEAEKVKGATIRTYDSIEPAFMELLQKRADAVINDDASTAAYLKVHGGLKTVGGLLSSESYGIAVRKDAPDILRKINEGLAKVRASGEYDRLRKKWF